MVDPCRKINILSEEDQKFIDELEEEFGKRFTEEDPEFMALCDKKLSNPPIIDPWMQHRSNNRGGWRGGRNQRDSNRGDGHHNHHNQNNRGYRGGYNHRRYNEYPERNEHRDQREPMNYNRDGNSRDDRHYNPPR